MGTSRNGEKRCLPGGGREAGVAVLFDIGCSEFVEMFVRRWRVA
jgi:hypothetical protein